jgi:hypothetical protein
VRHLSLAGRLFDCFVPRLSAFACLCQRQTGHRQATFGFFFLGSGKMSQNTLCKFTEALKSAFAIYPQ